MPSKLSIGSFGPEVVKLQNFLNMLPSFLPRLMADGSFGNKTKTRTVEFQQKCFLTPDGIVGPLTWGALLDLIAGTLPPGVVPTTTVGTTPVDPTLANRLKVIEVARREAERNPVGVLAAKSSGGKDEGGQDFRLGHDNLLKYFRKSAPAPGTGKTYFNENDIEHLINPGELAPMRHWCGIFALWAIKTAGLPVGDWINGSGISSVRGFKQVLDKRHAEIRGCVGYINNGFEHHFIIEESFEEGFVTKVRTIEGNSDPHSNFRFKVRELKDIRVYSPYG